MPIRPRFGRVCGQFIHSILYCCFAVRVLSAVASCLETARVSRAWLGAHQRDAARQKAFTARHVPSHAAFGCLLLSPPPRRPTPSEEGEARWRHVAHFAARRCTSRITAHHAWRGTVVASASQEGASGVRSADLSRCLHLIMVRKEAKRSVGRSAGREGTRWGERVRAPLAPRLSRSRCALCVSGREPEESQLLPPSERTVCARASRSLLVAAGTYVRLREVERRGEVLERWARDGGRISQWGGGAIFMHG